MKTLSRNTSNLQPADLSNLWNVKQISKFISASKSPEIPFSHWQMTYHTIYLINNIYVNLKCLWKDNVFRGVAGLFTLMSWFSWNCPGQHILIFKLLTTVTVRHRQRWMLSEHFEKHY